MILNFSFSRESTGFRLLLASELVEQPQCKAVSFALDLSSANDKMQKPIAQNGPLYHAVPNCPNLTHMPDTATMASHTS